MKLKRLSDIAYDMHVTAMKMCKPGVREQDIFATIEGIALAQRVRNRIPCNS